MWFDFIFFFFRMRKVLTKYTKKKTFLSLSLKNASGFILNPIHECVNVKFTRLFWFALQNYGNQFFLLFRSKKRANNKENWKCAHTHNDYQNYFHFGCVELTLVCHRTKKRRIFSIIMMIKLKKKMKNFCSRCFHDERLRLVFFLVRLRLFTIQLSIRAKWKII